jgi:uncharacterized protein (TIGR02145 family)
VTTTNVTGITQTTAISGGNVTSDGNVEVTSRGICWNNSENPTVANSKTSDGTGTGSFTSSLTQLTPGTTYYVKAYATNSEGTAYGSQVSFSSNPVLLATLTTTTATVVTQTTAVSGGNISSDGGGAITAKGVCWGTATAPVATGLHTTETVTTATFTSNLTGLTANTKYYYRAYANNSAGTAYGDEKSFTTESIKTVIDIDGNVYTTVTLGTQVWMAENLKVTKYRNGDAIPNLTDGTQWYNITTGAYGNYDNNATNGNTYGRLYNWHAVGTGNLCPTGWHVPTDVEWAKFRDYLIANGYNYDGSTGGNNIGKALASATGWTFSSIPGNVGNTDYPEKRNATGFTALPAGTRFQDGHYNDIGDVTAWWLDTETYDGTCAWITFLWCEAGSNMDANNELKRFGHSVRCLKD